MPDGTEVEQGTAVAPNLPKFGASTDPNAAATGKQYTQAEVDRLIAADAARRARQSQKDRERNQRSKLLGGITIDSLEAAAKANGGNVRAAARDLALDQLLDGGTSETETEPDDTLAPAPGKAVAAEPDRTELQKTVVSLLNDGGIKADDPEYVALVGKNYTTETAFVADVANLALKRARGGAPANDALGPAASGGNHAGATDKESKARNIVANMRELMKNPTVNAAAIAKARDELKNLL